MEFAIWLLVGLAVGGAVGALATWWISRARGGAVSVMQLKQENDRFKNEVTEHFVETARLINQMTDSYKQVFDHLSSGAEKLVDEKSLAERLPPASGQEVKLSQFGASTPSSETRKESASSRGSDKAGTGNHAATPAGSTSDKASGKSDPLKSRAGESKPATERSSSGKPVSATADDKSGASDTTGSEKDASKEKNAGSSGNSSDKRPASTGQSTAGTSSRD